MKESRVPSFSILTPTAGKRPRALACAVESVARALAELPVQLEMLVGLDGCDEETAFAGISELPEFLRVFKFPGWGNFGNRVRNALMRAAGGDYLLFLDDDNALTPGALAAFSGHLPADMVVARIDVSRAFEKPYLPEGEPGEAWVRQCNIDPLCLCVSRDLALTRCGGWGDAGGYESDFLNIARYFRRACSVAYCLQVVGVYDAGRGLDPHGANTRQQKTVAGA